MRYLLENSYEDDGAEIVAASNDLLALKAYAVRRGYDWCRILDTLDMVWHPRVGRDGPDQWAMAYPSGIPIV